MIRISFIILFSIFITLNKSFSQVTQDNYNTNFEKIKKVLKRETKKILAETGIPSVSLTLIKADSIYWSDAFGVTNVKKKTPATSTTIYNTGSNFKFVTATAIMQLAESKKLNIDDPINNYLGENAIEDFSNKGTPVTFRHLLSHHSGLLIDKVEMTPLWERKSPKTLDVLASSIKPKTTPGVNFKYCNKCYGLLGLIIEEVSGMTFQDYIIENIFKPLQIESKGPVIPTPNMIEELALPYSLKENQPIPLSQLRFDVYPAGDIYLTTQEMANFYIAQLNNGLYKGQSILTPKSISEMQKPQFKSTYGFGIGTNTKYLTHTGKLPGFSTFFKAELATKTGVYIASNAGSAHTALKAIGNLALKLLNGNDKVTSLPSLTKHEFTEIKLTKEVLKSYIGKYKLSPKLMIDIFLEGRSLYAKATGQPKVKLFPYQKDSFFLKVIYAQVKFNTKQNVTSGLTLIQGASKKYGKKIK